MTDANTRFDPGVRPLPRTLLKEAGSAGAVDEAARARRLLAVLRFLTELRESERDDELLRTVLQAVAVWYDIEASAYRRDSAGVFVLDAWLPGVDISIRPRALPASVVSVLQDGPTLISSFVGLEEIGWRDAPGDILLVPITYGGRHQVIIAVGGTLDDDAVVTLAAVGLALGATLQRRVDTESASLRERLRTAREQPGRPDGEVAASVLQVLIEYVSAAGGRLFVESTDGVATLAESPAPAHDRADDGSTAELAADHFTLSLPLEGARSMTVELEGAPGRPFRPVGMAAVHAAVDVVREWLDSSDAPSSGAAQQRMPADFERRIDEEVARARRFGLELVVLLIGPAAGRIPIQAEHTLAEAIRGGLRGSDLIGRLGRGEIGVILVHTGVHGARSVEERLKGRLQGLVRDHTLPSITIGEGGFPSGGESAAALLSRARAQQTVLLNEFRMNDGV